MAEDFAEGWNKRATTYYFNDELEKSLLDIQKTLELEPRHFGAISGMGLIFLELEMMKRRCGRLRKCCVSILCHPPRVTRSKC